MYGCPSNPDSPDATVSSWSVIMSDPLALRKIDHVRFFVGNARQAAYFYRNAFGFDVIAYAGLVTDDCPVPVRSAHRQRTQRPAPDPPTYLKMLLL